ncbi:hypothetical protein CWO33_22180 [Vibrio splendidus]|jgi:hypothetical protein|uniref:hypothetical protein n=1 Tax=Vibrio TaxID=662 RepID=UPI000D3B17FB|nr:MULTISPECIES: hypothetical protein [Vibrio]MBE8568051.1 hypothetical protein [Vibrio sp. OPT20]PTQ07720.1 hypothetical protein CWO33_22180 [Vibrio splendidus]
MNWKKQTYLGAELLSHNLKVDNLLKNPDLLFDFTIYPRLYVSVDLDLDEVFESHHAMVSVTSKENYGYEFIQAVPKAQLSDGTSHMTYDESGLYLSEALVNALINCKPVTVMHRQLSL